LLFPCFLQSIGLFAFSVSEDWCLVVVILLYGAVFRPLAFFGSSRTASCIEAFYKLVKSFQKIIGTSPGSAGIYFYKIFLSFARNPPLVFPVPFAKFESY